ncbi:hypothetical protein N0V93_003386 [Gnomoniopsis smithogilvyi]|uniref:DJ-1/PfpI domain-containing protein n=1 Tax=Gnomoniopsis smithogilvyi TaxID=1191159 RepID=A0A9W9D023_9PEZI|nr:hypothetical protein N0V93_003386 [Gnomoniopsis smithogilvyi]
MSRSTSLHVAVFLPTPATSPVGAQLLDTACVDILAVHNKSYLAPLTFMLPPEPDLVALAPEIKISYVGVRPAGSLMDLTAGLKMQLTHHYTDEEVQPGKVDIVLVPGPDPRETWDPEALAWLKAHLDTAGTDILSICTGIFVCGAAGLLQGKKACGPRDLQGLLAEKFKAQDVQWIGCEVRWTRDGNFWSCGGVTNGNDLVSAYVRESGRFAPELVEFCLAFVDTGDRPQRYAPRPSA